MNHNDIMNDRRCYVHRHGYDHWDWVCSTFYKIIWIVRAYWLVFKWVFIALWSTKMTWAMTVSELWEFTASYLVFLFVKAKNENFNKRNKTCFPCLHSLVKTSAKFERIFEQWKPSITSRMRLGFSLICSQILQNARLSFHQAMKVRKTRFIS